jgi:hypothetical protein
VVGLGLRDARPRAVDGRYLALPVGSVFCLFGIVGNFLDPKRLELETAQ